MNLLQTGFANNFEATLVGAIGTSDTTLDIGTVAADYLRGQIERLVDATVTQMPVFLTLGSGVPYEIVLCYMVDAGSGTIQVLRDQQASGAQSWGAGTKVQSFDTRDGLIGQGSGWRFSPEQELDLSAGDIAVTLDPGASALTLYISDLLTPQPGSTLTLNAPQDITISNPDTPTYFYEGMVEIDNRSTEDVNLAFGFGNNIATSLIPAGSYASFRLIYFRKGGWFAEAIS